MTKEKVGLLTSLSGTPRLPHKALIKVVFPAPISPSKAMMPCPVRNGLSCAAAAGKALRSGRSMVVIGMAATVKDTSLAFFWAARGKPVSYFP